MNSNEMIINILFTENLGRVGFSSTILTITMTDSKGDGWNGNILGIMQDEVVLGTFGETFTSGFAPVSPI